MKVIFITRESKEMPAVRIRGYGFAKCLARSGYQTEIFSYADRLGAKSGKKESQLNVFDKIKYNVQAFKYLFSQKAIFVLQRCHYHSFAPLCLALFKRNKLILDLDDWEMRENIKYNFNMIPNSKALVLLGIIAKNSEFCVGASDFLCKAILPYNQNVIKIPTGVDAGIFIPVKKNENLGSIVLSWVGTIHRLDNVENLRFLIDCFQLLNTEFNNIKLEIVGEGIYGGRLSGIIDKVNNPNIILKPWMKPEKMPQYLKNVDIGVMPLIQNTKFNQAKSPTRLFEYMAMEKVVVASAIGESKNIITNGKNGFLAASKDEFIAILRQLIINERLRAEIGRQGRKTILKKYDLSKVAKKLADCMNKLWTKNRKT